MKVSVENKVALYVFRIQYFDGLKWSAPSALKTVSVEERLVDSWDPQCIGTKMTLSGPSVKIKMGSGNGRAAVFGKMVISEGTHSWTIRADSLDKTGGSYAMFGIWKTQFSPEPNKHMNDIGRHKSYFLAANGGKLYDTKKGSSSPEAQFTDGDVVKMTLDLEKGTLSYAVNGTVCGKVFDVEKESYRVVCSLYYTNEKVTLLSS